MLAKSFVVSPFDVFLLLCLLFGTTPDKVFFSLIGVSVVVCRVAPSRRELVVCVGYHRSGLPFAPMEDVIPCEMPSFFVFLPRALCWLGRCLDRCLLFFFTNAPQLDCWIRAISDFFFFFFFFGCLSRWGVARIPLWRFAYFLH